LEVDTIGLRKGLPGPQVKRLVYGDLKDLLKLAWWSKGNF